MEWNNEKTLLFIEQFRTKEILWDPQNPQHYNKLLKNDAWEELATETGCTADECRKKMTSLLASLRRERGKYMKSLRTKKGPDEIYKSSWFAYKSLEFMLDRNNPRPTLDTVGNREAKHSLLQREGHSFQEIKKSVPAQEERDYHRKPSQVENFSKSNAGPNKRKRTLEMHDDEIVQSALQILHSSTNRFNDDECNSFGSFIANKLRKYSQQTKNYVQHIISNIIFSADQGEFDHYRTNPKNLYPPHPSSTHTIRTSVPVCTPTSPSNTENCQYPVPTPSPAETDQIQQKSDDDDIVSHISDLIG